MPSYGQRDNFTCPQCGKQFEADIWLIADTTELPEIIEQLRRGTLHQVTCPDGHVTEIDAPLLLYRPGSDPAVLFVPAKHTSAEEDRAQTAGLAGMLKDRLGSAWNDTWTEPLSSISQELARFLFSPEGRGWSPMQVGATTRAVFDAAQCETWSEVRERLENDPSLLSPLADKFLEQVANDQQSEAAKVRVEAVRGFLGKCRAVGSDRALAEKLDAGESRIDAISSELIDAIKAYMAPPTWEETRDALERATDVLLTASAVDAMQTALPLFANDEGMQRFIKEHLDVLTRSMRDGVDGAFSGLSGRKFAPPDATVRLINARVAKTSAQEQPRYSQQLLEAVARERDLLESRASTDADYRDVLRLLAAVVAQAVDPKGTITAIEAMRQRLDRTEFPILRAVLQQLLAQATKSEADNTGAGFDLAIEQAAVLGNDTNIRDTLPEIWGAACNVIAEAYRERPDGNIRNNIEDAIAWYRKALEVFTFESRPEDWAQVKNNMGAAYAARIEGPRAENIEFARDCYEKALRVRTMDALPREWAITQNNLANAFLDRTRGPRGENCEAAIRCFHQAMRVLTRTAYPTDWALVQNNLGTAYRTRPLGENDENLDRAQACLERALKVWTKTTYPNKWAMATLNLANVSLDRALRGERASEERAEEHYSAALELYTRDRHPHAFGRIQNSLGLLYESKARRETGSAALNYAIERFRSAFEVFSHQSAPDMWAAINFNLGLTCARAGERSLSERERQDLFRQARQAFVRALSVYRPSLFPHFYVMTARQLGDLHFRQRQWKAAHVAYRSAFAAGELLYQAAAAPSDRNIELEEVSGALGNDAYAVAKLNLFGQAVEDTERRLARGIAEILGRRGALLDQATPADRASFESLRELIDGLEAEARSIGQTASRDYATIAGEIRAARHQVSTLLVRITQYLPDFVPSGLSLEEIGRLVRSIRHPLVYLVTTIHGSLALIVDSGTGAQVRIKPVWCDDFKLGSFLFEEERDRTILENYLVGIMSGRPSDSLPTLCAQMSRDLMSGVNGALAAGGAKRATFITTGTLSLLPLPAAAGALVTACAPSGRVIEAARKSLARRDPTNRLLIIGDPATGAAPLPFAGIETRRVAAMFGRQASEVLLADQATRANIASVASKADYFHFAGHSYFDVLNPLSSAMLIAGGERICLQELLENQLDTSHVRLFVLSSCQTALRDLRVPDEAIGFPGALMQAGVPAIISTLWPVADISTSLLMVRFYEHYLHDSMNAPAALASAQSWIRTSTAAQLRLSELHRSIYLDSGERDEYAFRLMRYFGQNQNEKPFEHPFFWAGFVFYGLDLAA